MKKHIIKCYDDLDMYHISRNGNLVSFDGIKINFVFCGYCKSLFATRYKSLYCSVECKYQHNIKRISHLISKEGYKFISYITVNGRGYVKSVCPNNHEYLFLEYNWKNGNRCQKCTDKYKGLNNPSWKGGYYINNIPLYDVYHNQLTPYGIKCRRNDSDDNILEVRCMYCGKWYTPTIVSVRNKIQCINGELSGEHNLYCSNGCKYICPTYNQKLYPKGFKVSTSREVQSQLRKMVFERDSYICQKCGNNKYLHCHHFTGVEQNPIESADIDNCITLCKECHMMVHRQNECRYYELGKC